MYEIRMWFPWFVLATCMWLFIGIVTLGVLGVGIAKYPLTLAFVSFCMALGTLPDGTH